MHLICAVAAAGVVAMVAVSAAESHCRCLLIVTLRDGRRIARFSGGVGGGEGGIKASSFSRSYLASSS